MSAISSKALSERDNLLLPFASAIVITLFLFFIDEGYYDFRWMLEWGNWIVFVIYLIMLFPIQWVIARFLFKKFQGKEKAIMMLLVGIPITLVLFYLIVM